MVDTVDHHYGTDIISFSFHFNEHLFLTKLIDVIFVGATTLQKKVNLFPFIGLPREKYLFCCFGSFCLGLVAAIVFLFFLLIGIHSMQS